MLIFRLSLIVPTPVAFNQIKSATVGFSLRKLSVTAGSEISRNGTEVRADAAHERCRKPFAPFVTARSTVARRQTKMPAVARCAVLDVHMNDPLGVVIVSFDNLLRRQFGADRPSGSPVEPNALHSR
jgi:hypothetical protein